MSKQTASLSKLPGKSNHSLSPKRKPTGSMSSPTHSLLHLQGAIGNRAVQRLIKSGTLQEKLKIGKPNDKYEQEADRVADQVMSMPDPGVQRQPEEEKEEIQTKPLAEQITPLVQRQEVPDEEEEEVQTKLQRQTEEEEEEEPVQTKLQRQEKDEEEEPIQAKPASNHSSAVSSNIESSVNSLKGGGQPLSESTRSFFEPRFGADLSGVRIHHDTQAAEIAKSINAKAFTTGKDIAFGSNQYSPGTSHGKRLLAHELTHTVQQGYAPSLDRKQIQNSYQYNNAEPIIPIKSETLQGEMIQTDILDALAGRFRDIITDPLSVSDPIEQIFDSVVATNRAMASRISIPPTWVRALMDYSSDNVADGLILIPALARLPSFFSGGWIMSLQPGAVAMTLDHSIFVRGSLSLRTYIHELVHVWQYMIMGVTLFLTSYFGMSAATIAYRWLRGLPTNRMRSSPHEEQAYNLEDRFVKWYNKRKKKKGTGKGTGKEKFYMVKSGDTLSKIAEKFYGDASKYNIIFKANRDIIKNPNLIYPGQKLKIP